MFYRKKAIRDLYDVNIFNIQNKPLDMFYKEIPIDETFVENKIKELQNTEPLRLLRIERDKLLTASDWRMTKDYPYADQPEWEDYRFELRELPQRIANGEVPAPTLDENDMLMFDEWPLKPGETE